jgi:hypothetical protein
MIDGLGAAQRVDGWLSFWMKVQNDDCAEAISFWLPWIQWG